MDRNSSAEPPLITPAALESAQPVRALRGLSWPLDLQPAVHFDPRLPGHAYTPQENRWPGLTLRAGFYDTPTRDWTVERFFTPTDPDAPRHTTTRNVTFHGRLFEEGKMLALAAALERRLGVWDRHPDV
jgi:hypothetical protein